MPPDTFGEKPAPPSGTIALWADALADIPAGWVICDGNNGTPNLLGRFVRGVPDATTDPGATGGSDSVTLSTSQIASHAHSTSLGNAGSHAHTFQVYEAGGSDREGFGGSDEEQTSSTDGSHSHTATSNSTGSGSSIENRPSYFEAAYIMKT